MQRHTVKVDAVEPVHVARFDSLIYTYVQEPDSQSRQELITEVGFPKTVLLFLQYLTPAFHNNLPNKSSGLVPFPLFADIFLYRCSFVRRSIIFHVLKAVYTTSKLQKYLFNLDLRGCCAYKHKKHCRFIVKQE